MPCPSDSDFRSIHSLLSFILPSPPPPAPVADRIFILF